MNSCDKCYTINNNVRRICDGPCPYRFCDNCIRGHLECYNYKLFTLCPIHQMESSTEFSIYCSEIPKESDCTDKISKFSRSNAYLIGILTGLFCILIIIFVLLIIFVPIMHMYYDYVACEYNNYYDVTQEECDKKLIYC